MEIKPYKSYPVSHFSKARVLYYFFILNTVVRPFLFYKVRPKVIGWENVPRNQGNFIVASNHISMVDPPLLAHALAYPIAFMAKRELFNAQWKAAIYRSLGTFALDRDNPDSATLKTALNVLKSPAGWALGIFPEGTRSTTGEILPFKKGLGSMAHKTGVPVVPVGITRFGKNRLLVRIGKPITGLADAEAIQDAVYKALVDLTQPATN